MIEALRLTAADLMGNPARVSRALEHVQPPADDDLRAPANIHAWDVPQWQRLNDDVPTPGHAANDMQGHPAGASRHQMLAGLIDKTVHTEAIDIREVGVLAASKSNLKAFATLGQLATKKASHLLETVNNEAIEDNLAHHEVRIMRPPERSPDYFQSAEWDGRVQLHNDGGSHHFAAAHWLACKLDYSRCIRARHVRYTVNRQRLHSLTDHYQINVMPDYQHQVVDDALARLEAPWYWLHTARPLVGYMLIFLPRDNKRSAAAARAFEDARFPTLTDALAPPAPLRNH